MREIVAIVTRYANKAYLLFQWLLTLFSPIMEALPLLTYTLGLDADTSRPILKNRKCIYITANYDKPKGSIYQEEILEEEKKHAERK